MIESHKIGITLLKNLNLQPLMPNRSISPQKIALFIATGMYTGYSPIAPGTVGSLIGVIICVLLSGVGPLVYLALLSTAFLVGVQVASMSKGAFAEKDPSPIVCDEIIGYMFSMFMIPVTLLNIIIVFLLFRFFDIVKPFPIRIIDKRMESGFGIVLDDILAGVYTNIVFHIVGSTFFRII